MSPDSCLLKMKNATSLHHGMTHPSESRLEKQANFYLGKDLQQNHQFHFNSLCEQTQNQAPELASAIDSKWERHSSETNQKIDAVQKLYQIQQSFYSNPIHFDRISQPSMTMCENQIVSNNLQAVSNSHNSMSMDDQYEDIDEDDASDFEEEEQLRELYNLQRDRLVQVNMTTSLLNFAESVTDQLQKYLARTKDQDDACDIYENKWGTTKSGRELYYADLLRIAQGDTDSFNKSSKKSSTSTSPQDTRHSPQYSPDSGTSEDTRGRFRGIREPALGLGPLGELFEFSLKNETKTTLKFIHPKDKTPNHEFLHSSALKQLHKEQHSDNRETIPMHERIFPASFWKEPSTQVKRHLQDLYTCDYQQKAAYSVTQKLPDFTDLMESWQGETERIIVQSERLARPEESNASPL